MNFDNFIMEIKKLVKEYLGEEVRIEEKTVLKNNGVKSITMGKRILRAETAVIALTSVVMFAMGEWDYE